MKRLFTYSLLFAFFFYACKKDNNTVPEVGERGTIIGHPTTLATYTKSIIAGSLIILPGDLSQQIHFNYDVELIKIIYSTIDPYNNPAKASGLLVIPKNAKTALPLVSYQHGTILKKTDVPSRRGGLYEVGLVFGTEGYVVACPDYLGMGDGENLHPYLHAKSEATAVIDFIRAAKIVCNDKKISLNNQLFLMGYSQGGHATMAALKMLEEQYSSELPVTACAAMAGPYDLSDTQLKFVLRDTFYNNPGFLPYVIYAYNPIYNMYSNLGSVFLTSYYDKFNGYFNDNPSVDLDVVNLIWPSTQIPTDALQPEFVQDLKNNPDNALKLALKDNDLYDWEPKSLLTLCHCDSDKDVSYQNSVVANKKFIENGSVQVTMINPLPGGDHYSCAIPSFKYTLNWFNLLKE
jgi:hypothetical protein